MIVPVDQEGLYIPPVTGTPQEDKLLTLSAELSRPLGKIAAMCIGDDDGALSFEKPCWTDELLLVEEDTCFKECLSDQDRDFGKPETAA